MRVSLTKAQAHAMTILARDWLSASDIGVSLLTLDGLFKRGMVEHQYIAWLGNKRDANLYRRVA